MKTGEEKIYPSKEDVKNKLFSINPDGNFAFLITKIETLILYDEITFEELIEKYRAYFDAKSTLQYGQFTAKKDKIISIEEFIDKKMFSQTFNKEFTKTNPALDKYLFGQDVINKEN